MRRLDESQVRLSVFTEKEGLLSAVAHDLHLEAGQLTLEIDEGPTVNIKVPTRSLRVVTALESGQPSGALTSGDHDKIEDAMRREVLKADAFPHIEFSSTSVGRGEGGYTVQGILRLCGVEKEISARIQSDGERYKTKVILHQPDFGITPYKALMGALKVAANVTVEVSVKKSDAETG